MTTDLDNNINNYKSISLYVEWDLTTEDNEILTFHGLSTGNITIYRDTILELADLAAGEDGDFSWDDFEDKLYDWLYDTQGWNVSYHEITDYELLD